MIVSRTKTGEWVLLNELKEIVQSFNTREEAVEALKTATTPKKKHRGCSHGNMTEELCALGPIRINQGWFGRFCRDCNWFFPRGSLKKVRAVIGKDFYGNEEVVFLLQKPRITWTDWLAELAQRKENRRRWPTIPSRNNTSSRFLPEAKV